jgi:hypothetical protein
MPFVCSTARTCISSSRQGTVARRTASSRSLAHSRPTKAASFTKRIRQPHSARTWS